MGYQVTCSCGNVLAVSDGMAGSTTTCSCGRTVSVPSLSQLRRHAVPEPAPHEPRHPRVTAAQAALWTVGAIVFGTLFVGCSAASFAASGLAGLGAVFALVGQLWLLGLMIRECHPDTIFLALVIPFFTWYFAFQRWDVAKWPFLINVGGVLVNLLGLLGRA